jgi:uncharacterized protein (DUF58 family)
MARLSDLHTFLYTELWSRGLAPNAAIRLAVGWPLVLLPFLLFSQIVTPHGVWVVLLVVLIALYVAGYLWVRSQVQAIAFERRRQGAVLVAGDTLREEFVLQNFSRLPVLWAEFADDSTLESYNPGSVVAAPVGGSYRWWKEVECSRRGVFRLGPHRVRIGDPFGLFTAEIRYDRAETLLIYPRVVQLPQVELPRGSAGGSAPRRRPQLGVLPAASVRDYAQGDSMRHIHWPSTAHRAHLMVKELEVEPSGDVWIVLNLQGAVQRGEGRSGTLEYGIILAASMAAEMVSGRDRRAVGLLTVSGEEVIALPPQGGQAQLWAIMAALAPARPTEWSLAELLRRNLRTLGRRHTLIVITPPADAPPPSGGSNGAPGTAGTSADAAPGGGAGSNLGNGSGSNMGNNVGGSSSGNNVGGSIASSGGSSGDWIAQLVQAQRVGLAASVLLVAMPEDEPSAMELVRRLTAIDIPAQVLRTDLPLRAALTYRRKRKVIRTTPTGGAYTVEVEEEVG